MLSELDPKAVRVVVYRRPPEVGGRLVGAGGGRRFMMCQAVLWVARMSS